MLAATACDDPEPTATPSTVPPSTVTAEPTVASTKDPIPTPTPLSVEAVVEGTAASMRALKSAHIEADIRTTARAAGEEEGTVEMSVTGDYQARAVLGSASRLPFKGTFSRQITSLSPTRHISWYRAPIYWKFPSQRTDSICGRPFASTPKACRT